MKAGVRLHPAPHLPMKAYVRSLRDLRHAASFYPLSRRHVAKYIYIAWHTIILVDVLGCLDVPPVGSHGGVADESFHRMASPVARLGHACRWVIRTAARHVVARWAPTSVTASTLCDRDGRYACRKVEIALSPAVDLVGPATFAEPPRGYPLLALNAPAVVRVRHYDVFMVVNGGSLPPSGVLWANPSGNGKSQLGETEKISGVYQKKKIHTLTLGEALMPAGLSVEARIMRHA